jgi:hypothetical protein
MGIQGLRMPCGRFSEVESEPGMGGLAEHGDWEGARRPLNQVGKFMVRLLSQPDE